MGMVGYFDITVTEIDSMVQPDRVTDDIGWESMALVSTHGPIPAISAC